MRVSPQLHQDTGGVSEAKLGRSEERCEPIVYWSIRHNLQYRERERVIHNSAHFLVFLHLELLYEQAAEVVMTILRRYKQGMEPRQVISLWMPLIEKALSLLLEYYIVYYQSGQPVFPGALFLEACPEPCQEKLDKLNIPDNKSLQ